MSASFLTGLTLAMPIMSGTAAIVLAQSDQNVLLRAIVLDMSPDAATVTAPQYDSLFAGGDAVKGVSDVIAAGRFRGLIMTRKSRHGRADTRQRNRLRPMRLRRLRRRPGSSPVWKFGFMTTMVTVSRI